jgi:glutathione S-transferase
MQLYLDPASTTGRPLLMLIAELGLEIELRTVNLMAGEHRAPAFLALNPNGQVPVLVDGDLRLTESAAILRYLAAGVPTALLPGDRRGLAQMDEALDWFKTGFSADFCTGVVYAQLLPHMRYAEARTQADVLARSMERAAGRFEVLDRHVLGGRPYVAGQAMTLADLVGATMVTLGEAVGYDLSPYPNVLAWIARMKARPSWRAGNQAFEALKAHFGALAPA